MVYSPAASLPTETSFPTFSLPQLDLGNAFAGLTAQGWFAPALVLVATLLVFEQSAWRWRKAHMAGLKWQIPLIGQFFESLNPTMEGYMRSFANPLAAVSVFNIFIVLASTTDYSRRILNSSTYTEPCLVRSAKQILCPDNWVFLNGKVHNEYRKGLNCLFSRQALGIYLSIQERIYRSHFAAWVAAAKEGHKEYQYRFRDLNMQTSLRVFCGDYISQEHADEVSEKYRLITAAFELVNFPFAFPGTKLWHGIRARETTVKYLIDATQKSKKKMYAGGTPDCLLDQWVAEILAAKQYREGTEAERPNLIVREYEDREMALVLLSFIFASQDAMSSSLTYAFQHLADYPEVLAKVREEQYRVRHNDIDAPLSLDRLDEMPYTHAVCKEVLRHRPPVIMVPYKTLKPFPLDDSYTVPAGTMIIPTFWNSLHDETVYPNAEDFIPERWMPGGVNDNANDAKAWLVFGAGAHRCIGQSYVMMHMTAVVGSAAVLLDWTHERTKDSDNMQIMPTIFPKDGCRLKFSARAAPQ